MELFLWKNFSLRKIRIYVDEERVERVEREVGWGEEKQVQVGRGGTNEKKGYFNEKWFSIGS